MKKPLTTNQKIAAGAVAFVVGYLVLSAITHQVKPQPAQAVPQIVLPAQPVQQVAKADQPKPHHASIRENFARALAVQKQMKITPNGNLEDEMTQVYTQATELSKKARDEAEKEQAQGGSR